MREVHSLARQCSFREAPMCSHCSGSSNEPKQKFNKTLPKPLWPKSSRSGTAMPVINKTLSNAPIRCSSCRVVDGASGVQCFQSVPEHLPYGTELSYLFCRQKVDNISQQGARGVARGR